MTNTLQLEIRRSVRASAERIFQAWTQPAQLRAWWGPEGVTCPEAEVDLRVGGMYRIANRLPDGNIVWITGRFEQISPPHELIYTWRFEPGPDAESRVTVRFEPNGDLTDVVVLHQEIPDEALRVNHEGGWHGCLDGLVEYLSQAS